MFDQCLYFNTSALARRLEREWAEAFEPFGVTPPQGFMLRAILDRPGMLAHEVSDMLSIARPTATRALDGLEARGYIERRRVEGDGREVAIYPTAQALAIKQRLNDASGEVTARLKAQMGGAAFAETVHKIRAVRSALK
ncbi:MarR family winged helix-turn-helix transcriptional regulator [Trinickia acidisoli]|uniref:MarR family winged helix-turn-helix transcriptional regulator n=1 Tax=Trinickia acidisoli TaxID=2767482 RepID=UPI001A8C61BA|nr:MarR family transcriptional regulator [Trinickia acidisoli]